MCTTVHNNIVHVFSTMYSMCERDISDVHVQYMQVHVHVELYIHVHVNLYSIYLCDVTLFIHVYTRGYHFLFPPLSLSLSLSAPPLSLSLSLSLSVHVFIESQSLIEALKSKASERVLNKEVGPCGWSISCPSLCDGSVTGKLYGTVYMYMYLYIHVHVTVCMINKLITFPLSLSLFFSLELVHSLTSSGSNIEKPVAPNGFTPTTPVPDPAHQPSSSDTPHNSLETDLVSSTSPHPLPLVCVENTERGDKVCFAPSPIKTQPQQQQEEEEEEEQFFSMAGYAHSSGEENEEPKTTLPNPPKKNLFSKSAPSFVEVQTQPSTVDADYVIIDSVAPPINTSNEVSEPQGPDVVPSDALLSGNVATTPSTPVSTPPIHIRTHKKSHSMSGVVFVDRGTEQERRLDTAQSNASSMMSIDSSKPTTTTTSSCTSSEDEEDESAFETANEISFKSKSGVSIDDGPFVSLEGSFPFKPYLVLDEERRGSDDDVDGGADKEEEEEEEERRKLSLVQERRYSLNVVTNIDDFSASSEDDAGNVHVHVTPHTVYNFLLHTWHMFHHS